VYLKALEIQGFKSFPDKVRLEFNKDLTAIVGPNGSGKSNISDAISWVMGEQRSKALRGAKMEDVIFGGNGQRAASGFAQVSLIFDNSGGIFQVDSQEVMITRRFYKSGESEYYINKTPVRLKDVNELLMDTGLGRDGYSIIGQGRVDEILSAKSTDRREVFEEAAGISKFRYRKEETQRKIEKTEENLLRVGDKIAELELQVIPLKKQAETAKRYLKLRDELKGLEITIWLENLDKLRDKTQLLTNDFMQAGQELESEKQSLERLYLSSNDFTEEMRQLELKAEQLRAELSQSEASLSALESEIAVCLTDIKNINERIDRLNQELSDQDSRDVDLQEKIKQRISRREEISAELSNIEQSKNELNMQSGRAEEAAEKLRLELSDLSSAISLEEGSAAALEAKINTLNETNSSLSQRGDAQEAERLRLSERLEEEAASLTGTKKRLSTLEEETAAALNAERGFALKAESRRKRLDSITEKRGNLKIEEGAIKSRIHMLSEMEKEYEGFSKAVKVVMRESGRGTLRNIHGTVADIIKTDDKYALAIETALGTSLQSIVVDREEDGKSAINLLKNTDSGRATFLPISVIRGSELNEKGLDDEYGFEGIASRLVSCEDKYKYILLNLLGRTVIAEDMDSAIRLSRKFSAKFRIVTLDGQIINSGGSMTGGSSGRSVGILSRANELIRLQQEAAKLSQLSQALEKEQNEAEKELAAALYQQETSANELRLLQDELIKLRAEAEHREILISSVKESLLAAERACKDADSVIAENLSAIAEAREKIALHRARAAELRAKADIKSQEKAQLDIRLSEYQGILNSLSSKEASLSAESEELVRGIEELNALLTGFGSEKESKKQHIAELQAEIVLRQREAAEKQAKAAELRTAAETSRSRLNAVINEKLACEAKKNKTDRDAQDKNKRIIELERQYAEINQRKLAAELEEKQIVDKLWDSYELSPTAAQKLRLELDSLSKANRRIAEIRKELSSLGSPNIGAIEEFERVNERYTFLKEQRDDIEKAKKELQTIVNDITAEMERIFASEFALIAKHFSETFMELFGGGKAELILEDENDILNCGIEIKIQPPGKTPKSLTLLSGGERAFVAIALYFAILKVRPTPFCVLDEIEAALDESNVSRFAAYLRKMSSGTQFIVITHRRGTMEEADELFGVTMQKGISRVLSVDLEQALSK
jgi:chromosome segregation protein